LLRIKFPSNYNQSEGVNTLLIKYGSGFTLKDKLSFSILKISYLGLWLTTKLVLGEKKRKNILSKIEFRGLMAKFVGPNNMIECEVPKYGYKSYCRTYNSFNDLVIMTKHDDDMLQLFRPIKRDIVVDVGAYVGRYTLTSSKRVGDTGKVIAIEGDLSHYEMLNKNLKLNRISNVTAINCMVGSKDMDINYQDFLAELDGTEQKQLDNTIIHVNSLDNLLVKECKINEVNWIKIDVEGMELEVLKGAHIILSKSKRIKIQIEIHGVNKLYKPIVELLNSYNFKIIFEKDEPNYRTGDRIGAKQIIVEKFLDDKLSKSI
jgi:FkbM family methyltransferase